MRCTSLIAWDSSLASSGRLSPNTGNSTPTSVSVLMVNTDCFGVRVEAVNVSTKSARCTYAAAKPSIRRVISAPSTAAVFSRTSSSHSASASTVGVRCLGGGSSWFCAQVACARAAMICGMVSAAVSSATAAADRSEGVPGAGRDRLGLACPLARLARAAALLRARCSICCSISCSRTGSGTSCASLRSKSWRTTAATRSAWWSCSAFSGSCSPAMIALFPVAANAASVPGLTAGLEQQIECFFEQSLNRAVLLDSQHAQLLRDSRVEVTADVLTAVAGGCLSAGRVRRRLRASKRVRELIGHSFQLLCLMWCTDARDYIRSRAASRSP